MFLSFIEGTQVGDGFISWIGYQLYILFVFQYSTVWYGFSIEFVNLFVNMKKTIILRIYQYSVTLKADITLHIPFTYITCSLSSIPELRIRICIILGS
jgi:hypothetical protein